MTRHPNGSSSPTEAPVSWYQEKSNFDAGTNKSGFGPDNPDWFNWGHTSEPADPSADNSDGGPG